MILGVDGVVYFIHPYSFPSGGMEFYFLKTLKSELDSLALLLKWTWGGSDLGGISVKA